MRCTTAVLVLAHGEAAGWTPDQAAVALGSVARFWRDTTDGEAAPDFLPPQRVVLPRDHSAWRAVRERGEDLQTLVGACLAGGGDLRGAEAVLVVASLDGPWREFAVPVTLGGRTVRAAYVTCGSTHSVVAHEVGHLLGFEHTWGLHTPAGGVEGPEYGSPYCVMGMAFRDLDVSGPLLPLPGGPPPGSAFWTQTGPGLSRAELLAWRWRRHAHPPRTDARVTTTDGSVLRLSGHMPRAVAVAGTDDVLVLELRTPNGWDGRLALERADDPDTQDAPAVVVHRLQDVVDGDRLLPHRAWFVGSIAVPPSGDRDISVSGSTPTVVTLLEHDGDAAVVEVGPVGDRVLPHVDLHVDASRRRVAVTASTHGFEAVSFWWEVDGHVAGLGALGSPPTRMTYDGVATRVSWERLGVERPTGRDVTVRVVAVESANVAIRATSRVVVPGRWWRRFRRRAAAR